MQLGFKAVNPSSHEVNKIWNWIKTKSKPNSFFTSGKQWKAAAPPRRGKAAENWRKVKMEVLEAVNGGPLQFWNRKLLMLIFYNSSSSLHCICTFKRVDMEVLEPVMEGKTIAILAKSTVEHLGKNWFKSFQWSIFKSYSNWMVH